MNGIQDLKGINAEDLAKDSETKKLQHLMHKTIRNVTVDIEKDFHYNTAISFMMEFVNDSIILKLALRQMNLSRCIKNA